MKCMKVNIINLENNYIKYFIKMYYYDKYINYEVKKLKE